MTTPAEAAEPAAGALRRTRACLVALGAAVTLFGAFVLWKAFDIRQPTAYRPMGPRVFPVLIAATLIVLGVLFLVAAVRGRHDDLEAHVAAELHTSEPWRAGLVVVLLIGYTLVFNRLGYVAATTLFMTATARALGSKQVVRDAVAGAGVAIAAFLLFTRLLSIDLPAGVLGDVL